MKLKSPRDAIKQKIGMVSQHFSLVPPLTVSENIVLGDIPVKNSFRLNENLAREKVLALAESCGFKIDPQARVEDLSGGEQQRVEILKALYQGVDILILDEPTAALISQETEDLFKILRSMTSQKRSVIFITHKLREALLCDRITILRTGRVVAEKDARSTNQAELLKGMFGESVSVLSCKPSSKKERPPFLEAKNLYVRNDRGRTAVEGVSFNVLSGEIMGIAGVAGNGQRELVEAITGLRKTQHGSILLKGEDIRGFSARLCRERGIAHIPEDRLKMGLLSDMAIHENLILSREDKIPFVYRFLLNYFPILNFPPVKRFAEERVSAYDVKTTGINMITRYLSGGNLQKIVLAREFAWEPELIIAAQPTRGLDAKTVEFVHQRLLEQREKEKAVLLVSYDLDEVLELSDRIGVMYEGKMAVFTCEEADRNEIERMMVGAESLV